MPRSARIDFPGIPQHIYVRGNNRSPCFCDEDDRQSFMQLLAAGVHRSNCLLHAFVLMTNHVHLLVTGECPGAVSALMHRVGCMYANRFNRRCKRTGTLFEGRFKSSLVQSEGYFLTCMRYIECNPVRAGMVARAQDYAWSSHRQNASGDPGGMLSPHAEYLRLGADAARRAAAYTALFRNEMSSSTLDAVRRSTSQSRPLGCASFVQALEHELQRPVQVRKPGRPAKAVPRTGSVRAAPTR